MKPKVPMAGDGAQLFEDLMRFLPDGMTANAWAVKAGVSRTIWADLRRHGNPSRRTLEKLLSAAGSSLAEFEALRVRQASSLASEAHSQLAEPGRVWRHALPVSLQVVSSEAGGTWGDAQLHIERLRVDRDTVIDRVARPASLAHDSGAYAITIIGDSMWPRFRPGRRIAVSPDATVGVGDDVFVLLRNGQGVLVKELVRRGGGFICLRQFHPDISFDVPTEEITAIHRILGEIF